jgi:bacterioferritin-associated ferredoxin
MLLRLANENEIRPRDMVPYPEITIRIADGVSDPAAQYGDRESGSVAAMIVRSCNVLTDQDVRSTLSGTDAVRTTSQVYACLGCSVQCGRCTRTIRRIVAGGWQVRILPAVPHPSLRSRRRGAKSGSLSGGIRSCRR